MILSEDAFGHVGMGGSIGFADPRARMSFWYTMNRQGVTVGLDERGSHSSTPPTPRSATGGGGRGRQLVPA